FLARRGDKTIATRFQLRVLAKRLSPQFTPRSSSPVISPAAGQVPTGELPGCQPDFTPGSTKDSDKDLLPDVLEKQLKTDPCKADTDGDGVEDGYEYESALDLNSRALPYPGKRPYPNPLDPNDANIDFDGDSLTMSEEYA